MTDAYAVFGNPIGHSKSPRIHAAFARTAGQDMSYGAIEAPRGGFAEVVRAFAASGAKGANVTAPFKLDAYAGRRSSPSAPARRRRQRAQIRERPHPRREFRRRRPDSRHRDQPALAPGRPAGAVLGAGGAARGARRAILRPPSVRTRHRQSRSRQGARTREARSRRAVEACRYEDSAALPPFDIVLNSTSASWSGEAPADAVHLLRARRARLRSGLRQRPDAVPRRCRAAGAGASPMASACWSSRRPRRSSGGAACGLRRLT